MKRNREIPWQRGSREWKQYERLLFSIMFGWAMKEGPDLTVQYLNNLYIDIEKHIPRLISGLAFTPEEKRDFFVRIMEECGFDVKPEEVI